MRLHVLSVVFGALLFTLGTAHAVDRGQFENVPDDVRAWFKGVRRPDGRPCCDIADGYRTFYDVRAGSYWVPIDGSGGECRTGRLSVMQVTRSGKPLSGMSVFAGMLRSVALFRPMRARQRS
jgi:hypothetical protein